MFLVVLLHLVDLPTSLDSAQPFLLIGYHVLGKPSVDLHCLVGLLNDVQRRLVLGETLC